jgi:hypothetical protein
MSKTKEKTPNLSDFLIRGPEQCAQTVWLVFAYPENAETLSVQEFKMGIESFQFVP